MHACTHAATPGHFRFSATRKAKVDRSNLTGMYSTFSVDIVRTAHNAYTNYVTTTVGTYKMKLYRPATYPETEKLEGILKPSLSRAFLAPHHIEAYQPLHLEIGSNAITRSSMQ